MAMDDVLNQIREFSPDDIDWSRMGVWPVAGKVVFCTILVVAIIAGGYFFFIKSMNEELERSVARESELMESFRIKAHQAANLDAYRQQMAEMEESFGALVSQLPSDLEVPGLLEDIDEKGTNSGLLIEGVDLQDEKTSEYYVELPIQIKVRGPYHDLGAFVSGIAGMPRIVTLHDYSIERAKDGLLDMDILAKTYRYRDKGEE